MAVRPGEHSLVVTHMRYKMKAQQTSVFPGKCHELGIEIEPLPVDLEVVALDATTQKPLGGVEVSAVSLEVKETATTESENGSCRIELPCYASYEVTCRSAGYESYQELLSQPQPNDEVRITALMSPLKGKVSVFVLDAVFQHAVQGATLKVGGEEVGTSDDKGSVSGYLPPGLYAGWELRHGDYVVLEDNAEVEVEPGVVLQLGGEGGTVKMRPREGKVCVKVTGLDRHDERYTVTVAGSEASASLRSRATVDNVSCGENVEVKIRCKGYVAKTLHARVEANRSCDLGEMMMDPHECKISVRTDPEHAQVTIDGDEGKTRTWQGSKIRLGTSYTIKASCDHYDAETRYEQFSRPGQEISVDIDLSKSQTNSEGSEKKGCFGGSAVLQLQGGGMVRMADVRAGQRVLVRDGRYEPILGFAKYNTTAETEFLSVTVRHDGEVGVGPLVVTSNHIVMAVGSSGKREAILAGSITTQSSNSAATVLAGPTGYDGSSVVSVTPVVAKGYYVPVVAGGWLVANGCLCSCYAIYREYLDIPIPVGHFHNILHAATFPCRLWWQWTGYQPPPLDRDHHSDVAANLKQIIAPWLIPLLRFAYSDPSRSLQRKDEPCIDMEAARFSNCPQARLQ
eukprot:TRINITY_DN8699_c0_g3_i1.p1 TRINITY_DN8699_c0_g3~~TRINITY_DN8699_c0_g3_i1.p1  ORF type:complete len:625 (+),score=90.22 TRINITY_DN8699_c0_g3_i1:1271-3145(+)